MLKKVGERFGAALKTLKAKKKKKKKSLVAIRYAQYILEGDYFEHAYQRARRAIQGSEYRSEHNPQNHI